MNEWTNERMNEGMKEWTIEGMNDWRNERVNDGRVRGKDSADAHLKEASKDLWQIEMTE